MSKMTAHAFTLLLIPALLLGLLPSPMVTAQAQDTGNPPTLPAFACYSGATVGSETLCLAVPVQLASGAQAIGALVRATFEGRSLEAIAGQPANMPVDSAVATLDVGQLGARPGDMILLQAQWGEQWSEQLVSLMPHPATHTHALEPVIIGGAGQLGHSPIWGTVAHLDDRTPLVGATVRLYRGQDDQPIGESITRVSVGNKPTFELDPGTIPNDTLLRLEAIVAPEAQTSTLSATTTQTATVYIVWVGQQISVPIVLDWNCLGDIRRHRGVHLPDQFCLSGRTSLNDEPLDQAQVSVQMEGAEPLLTSTALITETGEPGFSLDIGELINGRELHEQITITVVKDGVFGQKTFTLGELRVKDRYGIWIDIPMREEYGSAAGLRGGTPRPVALVGSDDALSSYVGLEGGGVLAQLQEAGVWIRRPGSPPEGLPSPEVSALLGLGMVGDDDWLLAGTRAGAIALSQTGGAKWTTVLSDMGPITALTMSPDRSVIYATDRATLLRWAFDTAAQFPLGEETRQSLEFAPTALAVTSNGQIFAGAADGLWVSADDGASWAKAREEAITALLFLNNGARRQQILVGTETGLFMSAVDGSGWIPAGLSEPILGLASDDTGEQLAATTPNGLFRAESQTLTWSQAANSDTLTGEKSTIGTPDVLDLALITETGALLAATSTGVATSIDSGLNWSPFSSPVPGGAVRSIAPLPSNGMLALTAQGLYKFMPGGETETWNLVQGIPDQALNGAVIRTSQDGNQILLGRGAGPGNSLYASQDGGINWESISLGINRGVSAIAFLPTAVDGVVALVATDGDGVFGWRPGAPSTMVALPDLQTPGGQNERIAALIVATAVPPGAPCQVVVGTLGAPGRIASRPCDFTSAWSSSSSPSTGSVQALAVTPGQGRIFFAATSEGMFKGTPEQNWVPTFGLAMRPLSLLAPPDYATERLLVAGGAQAGVLRFSDIAPDVLASLKAPEEARGDEILTYTVELRNQGLLPITNGVATLTLPTSSVTLDPANQPLSYTGWSLSAGQVLSFTVTTRVHRDVKPPQAAQAQLVVDQAPNEQFTPNNNATATTRLNYRSGADLEVRLGGTLTTPAGNPGRILVQVKNIGDLSATAKSIFSLTLPPTATLSAITPAPSSNSNGILTWQINELNSGQGQDLRLSYTLPRNPSTEAALPIRAELSVLPEVDDREPANNQVDDYLRVPPKTPSVLVLTNLSRQSLNSQARQAIAEYVTRENGHVLALDTEGACTNDTQTPLACRYRNFDIARQNLANRIKTTPKVDPAYTSDIRRLAMEAVKARNSLVEAIKKRILSAIDLNAPPRYLYIIGGDEVIPSAAYEDVIPSNQGLAPEESHASSLDPRDSLYSVLRANHYVTDKEYERIDTNKGSISFFIGRQPGTSDQIAAAIELYLKQDGNLNIERGNVAGAAWDLTENTQQAICYLFADRFGGVEQQNCDQIPNDASNGLARLAQGNTASSLSGHATQYQLSGLRSTMIETSPMGEVNAILLLGCHSGLVPRAGLKPDPSLVDAFAGKGQPVFGYTGFAYASDVDGIIPGGTVYGERLQALLVKNILGVSNSPAQERTLGAMHANALADYKSLSSSAFDALSVKTLNTLTLYGPPTYRLMQAGELFQPVEQQTLASTYASQLPANSTIDLNVTYTSYTSSDGIYYVANVPDVETLLQIAVSRTIQPLARLRLSDLATGIFITGGRYTDTSNTDPVISRIAPVGMDSVVYMEPAYGGFTRDWATPAAVKRDSAGAPWALVGLGQWSPRGQTQRLFDTLSFQVFTSDQPGLAVPPALGTVRAQRRQNNFFTVSIAGSPGVVNAEVVLFENGALRIVPMKQIRKAWEATFQAQPGTQFLVQLLSQTGAVSFDTNVDLLYTLPTSMRNSPARLKIEPVSGNPAYPVAYKVTNIGGEPVDLHWTLNCWEPWDAEGVCNDSTGSTSLHPSESLTQGLGMVCARWQLDVESYDITRGAQDAARISRWRNVAEMPASCAGSRQIKLPLPFPATPVLDPFDRRDNLRIGPHWGGDGATGYEVRDQQLVATNGGPIYWLMRFNDNQEAYITLSDADTSDGIQGLLLKVRRRNSIADWRQGAIRVAYNDSAEEVQIDTFQRLPGWQTVARFPTVLRNGQQLGARALANGTVMVFIDGQLLTTADTKATNDSFFVNVGGYTGLWREGTRPVQLDDFGGGTILP